MSAIKAVPVFTQEMSDNGEIPSVGMSFLMKHVNSNESWARNDFYPAKMKAVGEELFIVESGGACNGKKRR